MISSSGIIKRGLAATAISALAVAGIPALAGTAHAAPGSVTVTALSAYDLDEFADATPATWWSRSSGPTAPPRSSTSPLSTLRLHP